jgi:hypothetical protein
MKAIKTVASVVSLLTIILIISLSGCKEATPSGSEINTGILSSHTWKIKSLMVDNVDKTSLYTGMTLNLTGTAYSTTNGSPVWPTTGTWSFDSEDGLQLTRNDGTAVIIKEISDDKLVFELNWTKTTYGGRVSSVSGHHIFTFVK